MNQFLSFRDKLAGQAGSDPLEARPNRGRLAVDNHSGRVTFARPAPDAYASQLINVAA